MESEAKMRSEILSYQADGCTMRGRLYGGGGAEKGPGILVFPEAFGLGEHAMGRAERLAELGFVALACDLHGEGAVHEDLETVKRLFGALMAEPARIRARAKGGLDALLTRPEVDPDRIVAIGYCFGGTMALELARAGDPIAAAVGFHCGLASHNPDPVTAISPRILVCIGADDPGIDAAQRQAFEEEMRRVGADWQMHLYGGVVHSFTNPAADARGTPQFSRYDAKADARSWSAMIALFEEMFGLVRRGSRPGPQ
jgi:dienelactone hydrolase